MTIIKEVELNFPGELKDEPIFYHIIKKFKVVPKIIEASFSTDMGWAIVKLEADKEEIDKLFKFLEDKGIEITIR